MNTRRPIATVLEPAEDPLLVDLETAKEELGISPDDTTQDRRLSRYLAQATSQIHEFCGRVFPLQAYRNVFAAYPHGYYRCDALQTAEFPITEVIGIGDAGIALTEDQWRVDAPRGLIWRVSSAPVTMPWAASEIVVDFWAGFPTIPAVVEAAALRLVRWNQGMRGWDADAPRDPMLRSREGSTYGRIEWFGNYTPGLEGGLPQEVAQMLHPYVRTFV